jgi:glutamate transport system substrate-binding protein
VADQPRDESTPNPMSVPEATDAAPAPEAVPDGPVKPRRSAMAVRLIAVAVALVLAVAVAFVVVVLSGPPSVDELRRQAGLDGKRQLLIGVKDDQPGVAKRQPDGSFVGFDIDIAYMIAEELDFRRSEVKFLSIESEDRARMQATDRDGSRVGVDLVIASYSITPAREAAAGVEFSAPYLFTEQSVVTLIHHDPVSTLEDLAGRKVCSLATATSETAAQKAGAVVVSRKKISECFTALYAGQVEAVSTDAAILAGFVALEPTKLKHHDIGLDATEAWGVNVGENDALRDLVNLALYRSRNDPKDARWEEAFDRNLRVEEPINRPAPIAVDAQPVVKEPDIRQWPWERVGP